MSSKGASISPTWHCSRRSCQLCSWWEHFFLLDNDEVDGVYGGSYNFEVDGDDGDDGGGPKIWSWHGYGEEVDGSFMIIRATVSDSSTHNLILVGEPKSDLLTSLLLLTSLPFLTSMRTVFCSNGGCRQEGRASCSSKIPRLWAKVAILYSLYHEKHQTIALEYWNYWICSSILQACWF